MKISIITVVFNAEQFIQNCIESVIYQSYPNIEYIIIDGKSTDGTLNIIKNYSTQVSKIISEQDEGLYDAINKGISLATGDVVGLLNADDMLVDKEIIAQVVRAFTAHPEVDAIYGDLNYIHPLSHAIVRKWRSKKANQHDIKKGWMPAHPTLYIRKSLFEKYGSYSLDLGTAADYDLMLRYFYTHQLKALYLPVLMVNMRLGGLSNKSLLSLWRAMKNDYKALKINQVPYPAAVVIRKKLNKLNQFTIK